MSLAVLVPTTGERPAGLARLEAAIADTHDDAEVMILAFPGSDIPGARVANAAFRYARGINWLAQKAVEAGHEWLLMGADDIVPRHDWWEKAMAKVESGGMLDPKVIGTNDLGNSNTALGVYSTHPLVRADYVANGTIDGQPGIMYEGYQHNFVDTELAMTAKYRGVWAHAGDSVVEHMHHLWGKAPNDASYQRTDATMAADGDLYESRKHLWGQ